MHPRIPAPVINVAAGALAAIHTHATMDAAFLGAGAPEPIPQDSKLGKARQWLSNINRDQSSRPLAVLGTLLSEVFDVDDSDPARREFLEKHRTHLSRALTRCGLRYESVGRVLPVGATPASRNLEQLLAERDWEAVHDEFTRALANVATSPADAVSAACNLLESVLKRFLEDEGHGLPLKKDVGGLWDASKRHLGLDPASMPETDMKAIVVGLATVARGIGALRTHASTAHGQGSKVYRLQPRHGQLAVNAAHTIATFVIETWDAKRAASQSQPTPTVATGKKP